MTQPIIHDYLTQIFVKHYKMQPGPAAQEALRFIEIIELYGMELIVGDWREQPKAVKDLWAQAMEEAAEREPWLAHELKN